LYKISKLFNTTTTNIINDNNLSSTNISPGKVLYVSCKTYIVQAGDSLYLIAKKYGIDLYTIRRANNIWNDNITPGQVLDIPIQYTSPNPTESKTIIYSSSDVDLLARLITSEAQGEPYSAMVAVGAVVINRVQSGSFANSINGVIYEKINGYYQFTPVLNGWINKPATSEAIKAANAALAGSDPTNGALFYFDNSTTNSWLWSKQISIIIDKLIFSY
jgi:spore germination cell wall hydrolase CwlJ-like protein